MPGSGLGPAVALPVGPIAQVYHAFTDNQIPYNVYGNRQDGASFMGPSNDLRGRGISKTLRANLVFPDF